MALVKEQFGIKKVVKMVDRRKLKDGKVRCETMLIAVQKLLDENPEITLATELVKPLMDRTTENMVECDTPYYKNRKQ